jgi:5-methylcytosine-specific restriction endonuclease McrA
MRRLIRRRGPFCHWCKRVVQTHSVRPDQATLDHLVPRSAGGSDKTCNLVIACRECNSKRGNVPVLDWVQGVSQGDRNRARSDALQAELLWQQLGGYRRDVPAWVDAPCIE